MKQGAFKIIRVTGAEEEYNFRPTIPVLHDKLRIRGLTVITLKRDVAGLPETIMLVDDTGALEHKPLNHKAMEVLKQYKGYQYSIHGDCAIACDHDFDN